MITVELVGGLLDGSIMKVSAIEPEITMVHSEDFQISFASKVDNLKPSDKGFGKINYRFRGMKNNGMSEIAVYEVFHA